MDASSRKSGSLHSTNHIYSALQKAITLAVIYVILLFLLPSGRDTINAYHLTMLEYHIISFAIALPSLFVWLAAFVGYTTLRSYAQSLRKTPETKHFERLATGCAWLAWGLPVTALLSLVASSLEYKWPGFHATSVVLTNYVTLAITLVAFSIIGMASRGLIDNAKIKPNLISSRIVILLFLIAGVFYCYLTFLHFDLSKLSSTHNPYFLPVWLMMITVMIPYLYTWFVGLLATFEIILLSQRIHGLIYRQALQLLVSGLVTIIFSSIALQYISGVKPLVGHLDLGYRLVAGVLFRIIGGAGFALLTIGALKLKRFEEI